MNNLNIVYHLFSNFNVNWDLNTMLDKFIENQINPINIRLPYNHPSKKPHWQEFDKESGILFARNFHFNFKEECAFIVDKLSSIKKNIANLDNRLVKRFLEEKFVFSKINLIKVVPNTKVVLHSDITRNIALNIGLKNSNTHITYVSEDLNIKNFDKSNKSKYILNDGDGYLISVRHPHCLDPIIENKDPRYVLTYTLN